MTLPRPLILCEHPTLLGGERSMLAAVDAMGDRVRPVLLGPSEGPFAEAIKTRGFEFVPFDSIDENGQRLSQEVRRERLAQTIQQVQPTVVHANSLSMARLAGPVVQSLGGRSLGHLRDIIKLSRRAIDDMNCNTRLLAVSAATRDFHVGQGLDPTRTDVLYNGVDLDTFHPRPRTGYLHRELGLQENIHLVVSIGQLGLRKAPELVPEVAAQVLEQLPDTCFLMIGSRWSEKEESRQLEASLHEASKQLGRRLRLLGVRSDVHLILNEADLLLHPARQEPLGRVLLEAAASGVPVVATDVGGTREIFPPKLDAAIVVEKDDVAAMAKSIVELLSDAARRDTLAANARRRAESQFDAKQSAEGLLGYYQLS